MLQDVQDQKINHFNSTRLIPDMNFTCCGTMTKVTVAGKQQNMSCGDATCEPMKLQIWRLENSTVEGRYQRVGNINLTFNITMTHSTDNNNVISTYECILNKSVQVLVKPGDILGIELPPERKANFKLYSLTESGLTNYIFERTPDSQQSTIDLSNRMNETTVLPLVSVHVEVKPSSTLQLSSACEYHEYRSKN